MSNQNCTHTEEDYSADENDSHSDSDSVSCLPEIQYYSGKTEGSIEEWIARFRPSQIRYSII